VKRNWLFILLIIIVVGLIVFFAWRFSGAKSPYQWRESFDEKKIDPYGTQILFELLKNQFTEDSMKVINKNLVEQLPSEAENANYIFVGNNLYMTEEDTDALLDFVANGNQAFLSSKYIPYDLMFHLMDSTCYESWWEDYQRFSANSVTLNLNHPDLKLDKSIELALYNQHGKKELTQWSYIPSDFFCEARYSPASLGYINNNLVNFARFPYEDGTFFIHTTPIVMTNIELLKPEKLQYVENVFTHLLEGSIYWDRYSRIPGLSNQDQDPDGLRLKNLSQDSPFRYVLSQPALAWAWYLTLLLALLYAIFRAKRRQPIIPVKEENRNTSLAFVQTIGRLYFLQNNHRKLAIDQMQIFLTHIREQYGMSITRLDGQVIPSLALRMGVPKGTLEQIAKAYDLIETNTTISSDTLIAFHQLIERVDKNVQ